MLELQQITKNFGSVQALRGVSLTTAPATIHGIVGENGAGKSTLMKIVTGFLQKNAGTIRVDGREMAMNSPREATRAGIGMLYQEPLDFPQLSVLENFMAGSNGYEPVRQASVLTALLQEFNFSLQPEQKVKELTVGERQQLELLRLIHRGIRLLILDEPTTGISVRQQQQLFAALNNLKQQGTTILLVSHKLAEIEQLCDEVTVLRAGETVAHQHRPFTRTSLLDAMFGTPLSQLNEVSGGKPGGEEVISYQDVTCAAGRSGMRQVNLTIRAGEVIGLAGVDGSGQSVFLKSAMGLLPVDSGRVKVLGQKPAPEYDVAYRTRVFLPADRLAEALFPGLSLREHHLLAADSPALLRPGSGQLRTEEAIRTANIRGRSESLAEELSGGNQQRLLLSLIPEGIRLILMENPTRGLDVQSARWTWEYLRQRLHPQGAIVFASPDLEEIMSQASRVLVFFNGRILLDKATSDTSYQEVSQAITGQPAAA